MAAALQSFGREILRRILPTSISIKTFPKHELVGHQDNINSLVFLQDNVHIVSGSRDGTIRKWDCETGLLVGEPWKVGNQILALALSPDGKTIACGGEDGVQRWDTNGQMMEGIWAGHGDWVRSLSWSPSGRHLASRSDDGTILIRTAESGEVEVGPIKAGFGYWVRSVAYSPLGDRIASGGNSISIWDSNTGELLVGPIEQWGYSVVWSLDGSKLYSAGDLTCVFDSSSGTELHRFNHDNFLRSITLSPKHNLLAGVGSIVQLWDSESYRPIGQPFRPGGGNYLLCVSFSSDGRYLAYGGDDKKITLRMVKDSTLDLPVHLSSTDLPDGMPQEATPESHLSSHLDVDTPNPLAQSAVNDDDGHDNPYKDEFFVPSHSLLPSPSLKPTPKQLRKRLTTRFFSRRIRSDSHSHPSARSGRIESTRKGDSSAVNHGDGCSDVNCSESVGPRAAKRGDDKGKQREDPAADTQTSTPGHLSSPTELDSDEHRALWKSLFRVQKKGSKNVPAKVTRDLSPKDVEVYARRVPQGYVAFRPKHKKKLAAQAQSAPTALAHADGLAPTGSSSHGGPVHAQTSLGGQAGLSSQPLVAHSGQPWEVTSNDSYSDWGIQSPWHKFLMKICYPCRDRPEDT